MGGETRSGSSRQEPGFRATPGAGHYGVTSFSYLSATKDCSGAWQLCELPSGTTATTSGASTGKCRISLSEEQLQMENLSRNSITAQPFTLNEQHWG